MTRIDPKLGNSIISSMRLFHYNIRISDFLNSQSRDHLEDVKKIWNEDRYKVKMVKSK